MNLDKGTMYALLTALLWGFLPIALKVAVGFLPPFTIVWVRFTLAFVFILTYFLVDDRPALKIIGRPPVLLILAALALGFNYLGFMMGIHKTSPSNAQVVIQMGPLLLTVYGMVFFGEQLRRQRLLGFVLVGFGLFLFYSDQIGKEIYTEESFNEGVIWVAMGAVTWSIYAVLQKRLVRDYPPQQLNLVIFLLPALMYTPVVDFYGFQGLSWAQWALIIFLGANTLVAYGSLSVALKHTEANKVSIIIIFNPVITFMVMTILGQLNVAWIKHEDFSWYGLLGAAIALAGVLLAVIRKKGRS